jgi:phage gp46-like protein
MSDLLTSLACAPDQGTDLVLAFGDLDLGGELSTAVAMSIFSDARARSDDIIPAGTDPRGWWADALDGEQYGSRLWLLERSNNTRESLARAKEYVSESLQWLIDDGVAKSIDVDTSAAGCAGHMIISVTVCRPDLKNIRWQWRYAWDLRELISCETQPEH